MTSMKQGASKKRIQPSPGFNIWSVCGSTVIRTVEVGILEPDLKALYIPETLTNFVLVFLLAMMRATRIRLQQFSYLFGERFGRIGLPSFE